MAGARPRSNCTARSLPNWTATSPKERIAAAEHASAVLEVQRRLLAAAGTGESDPRISSRGPVLFALLLVPLGAFALYLLGGSPQLPSVPLADRLAVDRERATKEAVLIAQLRRRLGEIDPRSEQARQGYILLGNAEASRGRLQDAADAWRTALAMRFDPTIAAEAAEAITEVQGRVTEEAAELFRHALAAAPADAPWRPMVQKRLSELK